MSEPAFSKRQRTFLEKARIGRLATIRRDGTPHIAPVWFMVEGDAVLILTDRGSQKHRNIERDPRVEFCIDDEQAPYHTVIVRGRVTVEEPRGPAWRFSLAVHYLGPEGGRRYVESTPAGDEVLLRIQAERVSGW
jgi:PPOX class probable F420-dependent enzyme